MGARDDYPALDVFNRSLLIPGWRTELREEIRAALNEIDRLRLAVAAAEQSAHDVSIFYAELQGLDIVRDRR